MSLQRFRICLAAAALALALQAPAPARSESAAPLASAATLEREALVRAVLESNPSLEAARQVWQALVMRVPQARALGDPMVSYEVAPLSIGSSRVGYGQVAQFGQRLPYPGKLRLAGRMAEEESEVSRLGFEALRLDLAAWASWLFDEYWFVHRALEINDEHLGLLRDFQRIAVARYTAGTAAQQDPIQAEVETAHLLHRAVVLETQRANLAAQINAARHRPPEAPLPPPPAELGPPPFTVGPGPEAQRTALAERPELQAAEAEIRGREAEVAHRKLDFRPDFEAMASYNSMWSDGEHQWMVGIGLHWPLRRERIRAGIAEAEARLAAAAADRTALEDAVRAEVVQAVDRLEEARHVLELYESRLLPASNDQVQAALAGFKTARNSFLALLEAERNQRSVRLEHQRALADAWQRRAELDRRLGRLPWSAHEPDPAGEFGSPAGTAESQGGSR